MKKTRSEKRLQLTRETVRSLGEKQLEEAAGGKPETWSWFCPSNPTIC